MSTLFNALIEEMEITEAKGTWDGYWTESIKEVEDLENADIAFESIVGGDNAVKKGLSGIMRWVQALGSNNRKLAWDMSIFEKIDKSKISKDVTGVATPEYVKKFTSCINNMKLLNESDISRIKEIAETLKKDPKAPRNFLRGVALVSSVINALAVVRGVVNSRAAVAFLVAFGATTGSAVAYTVYLILQDILWTWLWYFISKNNIDGASTNKSEVNELLDILAKLQNNVIGVEGSSISESSLSKIDTLIEALKPGEATTISVADQNKVADMLIEIAKVKDEIKKSIPTINKQGALGSIYSFGSEFKRGFKGVDPAVVDRCNDIIKLTTKVNTYMDALAGASKVIAKDIRKW